MRARHIFPRQTAEGRRAEQNLVQEADRRPPACRWCWQACQVYRSTGSGLAKDRWRSVRAERRPAVADCPPWRAGCRADSGSKNHRPKVRFGHRRGLLGIVFVIGQFECLQNSASGGSAPAVFSGVKREKAACARGARSHRPAPRNGPARRNSSARRLGRLLPTRRNLYVAARRRK